MPSAEDARVAGRLSIAYMMAVASEVLRRFPIDFLDLLLITTIANYNAQPAEMPPPRRGRRSAGAAGAGVSRNVVSRSLNVPLETVRRRIAALIEKEVLIEQGGGLVFSPENPIGIGNNADVAAFNLDQLRQLFRGLKSHGIELD